MQIIQDLVGPCRKHLTGCKKCMYEDYDDYEHYFGVTQFHFVEKLPSVLPENDSEQEARECQKSLRRRAQRSRRHGQSTSGRWNSPSTRRLSGKRRSGIGKRWRS